MDIKIHSEPKLSSDNKKFVRNNKGVDLKINEKPWNKDELIEVSHEEAIEFHNEGFKVLDDLDIENEKKSVELNPEE